MVRDIIDENEYDKEEKMTYVEDKTWHERERVAGNNDEDRLPDDREYLNWGK